MGRFQDTGCELRDTSYKLQVTSYKLGEYIKQIREIQQT